MASSAPPKGARLRALAAPPLRVSFEVDHIDDTLHEGWSVLVHGQAHTISDEYELEQARARDRAMVVRGTQPLRTRYR